eukprot:gnl/TRDRNA2_/TRDRNA2_179291_c0_seq1.p1 gnl/TRDRNA2_/TRDRNA2_179291_c0~~gnl/TRDRNA2_/TRDRNA2_179291_c0_seq1.p1  ORF type:complete len:571 (-),score=119.54 gnl/TRDRNA2_/TRDRNA2_179291_c0_seq1:41-1753(-)
MSGPILPVIEVGAPVETQSPSPHARGVTRRSLAVTVGALMLMGMLATAALVAAPEVKKAMAPRAIVKSTAAAKSVTSAVPKEEFGPAAILVQQLRRFETNDEANSEQERALRLSLGHIYRDQGRYTKALEQYERALTIAMHTTGGGQQRIEALKAVGITNGLLGQFRKARRDLEDAMVRALGEEGKRTESGNAAGEAVPVLRALGDVRRDMGHLAEALHLYNSAEDLAAAGCPLSADKPDPAVLAGIQSDIGEVHMCRGDAKTALGYFRKSLKLYEEAGFVLGSSGVQDPGVALTHSRLGKAHHVLGDVVKAKELYRRAVRAQAKTLRPGHPDLVFSQLSNVRAERDLGDLAGSLQTLEAIEKTLRDGPLEGNDLSRVLVVKGDLLREAKRYTEAEHAVKDALLQLEDQETPEVAGALNTYGSIVHDNGKLASAREHYRKALEVITRSAGKQHPEAAAAHNSLGTYYQDLGDQKLAEEHFQDCLQIQLKTVGAASPDVANTYNNIATVQFRRGNFEAAARLLRQALEVLDAAGVTEASPEKVLYKDNLERAVAKLSEITEVEEVHATVVV